MRNSQERARYEESLARAHRNLHYACEAAEVLHDEGAVEDILGIQREVLRLTEASLKGKIKRSSQISGQTSLYDHLPA